MSTNPKEDNKRPASPFDRVQELTISDDESGQRIDNYLLARLKGVPKSRIYRILRKGEVRVNKKRIKPEYKLNVKDVVRIPPIRVSENAPVNASLDSISKLNDAVLFENNQVMVINKPSGLAVHGGSGESYGVIEAFRQLRPDNRFLELVHRIDKETSGCLMIAKKRSVLRFMQAQFRQRQVKKYYLALTVGLWPENVQIVDKPLLRSEETEFGRIVRVNPNGKPSVSKIKIIEIYKDYTLVEVQPKTGRTHQIRVHCQATGHPLAGDTKYGIDNINKTLKQSGLGRLFLHASKIGFLLPDSEKMQYIEAPLQEDLSRMLTKLAVIREGIKR